jgi:hypothetical protein
MDIPKFQFDDEYEPSSNSGGAGFSVAPRLGVRPAIPNYEGGPVFTTATYAIPTNSDDSETSGEGSIAFATSTLPTLGTGDGTGLGQWSWVGNPGSWVNPSINGTGGEGSWSPTGGTGTGPGTGGPGEGGGETPTEETPTEEGGGGGGGGEETAVEEETGEPVEEVEGEEFEIPEWTPEEGGVGGGNHGGMLGIAGAGLGLATKLFASHLGKFAPLMGYASVGFAGWGLFSAFKGLGKDFSVMGLVNAAMSVVGVFAAVHLAGSAIEGMSMLTNLFALSNPYGWAIIAGIALVGWLMGRKKEYDIDITKGDPMRVGNTSSWYGGLPSQSVYYILTGVTALGIGIQLGPTSPLTQSIEIPVQSAKVQLPAVRNQLQSAVGVSQALPQDPKNLVGKVFVKVGNGTSIPDMAVYVTESVNGGYTVNKVSLNSGGYVVGSESPNGAMIPFFVKEKKTGAVIANPLAESALGSQRALTRAANGQNITATGAAQAVDRAAMTGHGAERYDFVPAQ